MSRPGSPARKERTVTRKRCIVCRDEAASAKEFCRACEASWRQSDLLAWHHETIKWASDRAWRAARRAK